MNEEFINFSTFLDDTLPIRVDFVGESMCDSSFYFSRKNSVIYALEYIISGSGVLKIDGKTYYPKKDDIFFLTKGSRHEYYCTADTEPWHKIFISVSGESAVKLLNDYLPENTHLFTNSGLKSVFENIYKIACKDNYDFYERNNLIVIEFMKILLSLKNNIDKNEFELADIIKRTLDKNLQKSYTINQLSKELNYTKNYLIDVFYEKFKETPYQYFKKRKIELAKEYLTATQFSVSDIAEQLSFTDSRYFASCFKAETGFTPTRFRKEMKQ